MILAEKIIQLRKQRGWSQEDLALKLNVSRQSVSKWESSASIPDLGKILLLSEIFGVSTDYLLKEDQDEPEVIGSDTEDRSSEQLRRVTLAEANDFLDLSRRNAPKIAAAVAVCILSPCFLITMVILTEAGKLGMTEDKACGIGVVILLIMVASAVGIFILTGMAGKPYEFLESERFTLEYGISGMVENRREAFKGTYRLAVTVGVILCILSPIPILIAAAMEASDVTVIYCVDLLLIIVAAAVTMFVYTGIIQGSYQKLLEEGDFTPERKAKEKKYAALSSVYWCTVLALYLGISFITRYWELSWIVWPVAGVFYGAVRGIAEILNRKE